MPWSNQSGGGGPGASAAVGGGRSPGAPARRAAATPPDLEDILRRGQDRLRDFIPGGGSMGGKGLSPSDPRARSRSGLRPASTRCGPNEVGINMIFGRYTGQTGEGLRYNRPYPIGQVEKPDVTPQQRIEVGYRSAPGQGRARDVTEESLMLTGDENIVDIDFDVRLAGQPGPRPGLRLQPAEPAGHHQGGRRERHARGHRPPQHPGHPDRPSRRASPQEVARDHAADARRLWRRRPRQASCSFRRRSRRPQVREAFFDVNAAQQDAVRVQNEAETFASRVVPGGARRGGPGGPAGRGLSRAGDRRGDRPGVPLQPGLRAVPQGAGGDPRAHLPRDDGARARRHGQGHHRPERRRTAAWCPICRSTRCSAARPGSRRRQPQQGATR